MSNDKIYTYKTKDSRAIFQFRYVDVGGYYEIDIMRYPDYGIRDDGSVVAHWLTPSRLDAERKICFTEFNEPSSIEQCKKYSVDWAELTWNYIKTGITIDDQITSRN